eukprot:scaffold20729_cov114-Isochrysis_galbana.AAC.3
MVVALEALDERPPTKAEAKIKPATLQLPNIKAAIHHIWTSVYKQYPTEEYGQAAVWTIAKQTIATFILDFQRQCEGGTHPIQDIKNQIKIAHSETDTQKPTQARIDNIKALEDKLQKTIQAQRKSATAAANKAAHHAESQAKQFYKKYRPSLKGGGIASLHTIPPTGTTRKQKATPPIRRKTCANRPPTTICGYFKKNKPKSRNRY